MRLNVVGDVADRELDAIRNRLKTFELVSGLDDTLAVLRACSHRGDRTEVLDAIGHSRCDGSLILGTWLLDDSPQTAASFRELLCPVLCQLGVRTIRILGCSTAVSERGRNAIRRIANVTRCAVFGTKRYVTQHDYAACGFISDDALIDGNGARPPGRQWSSSAPAQRTPTISLEHATKAELEILDRRRASV
jgi:hypothetical protein